MLFHALDLWVIVFNLWSEELVEKSHWQLSWVFISYADLMLFISYADLMHLFNSKHQAENLTNYIGKTASHRSWYLNWLNLEKESPRSIHVLNREMGQENQGMNGLPWWANKSMAYKRGLSKSDGIIGEHNYNSHQSETQKEPCHHAPVLIIRHCDMLHRAGFLDIVNHLFSFM